MFWFRKKPVMVPLTMGAKDIHNHLLPGVDDGFKRAEDSLQAIGKMVENGVKEIVFTPHMNPELFVGQTEAHLREVYADFCSRIPAEWGLKTSLAAEYMCIKDFEHRASDPELLTFEDDSVLVEMSYYYRSPNFETALFELVMAGKKPIVAHPERYLYMAECLSDFDRMAEMGCRFQMNYMSLTGAYGPESLKILRYLKDRGYYHFAATDLHTNHQLDKILAINVEKDKPLF